jgi:phytoene synthase
MAPNRDDAATLADYRRCRAVTREHAKSFYFASHVLPERKRMSAYAVYDFCRRVDNAVDAGARVSDSPDRLRQVESLRERLNAVYDFSRPAEADLRALRETVDAFDIPRSYFLDLLRGVEMDCAGREFTNFAELHEYCYCVASVVGLMMTRILGVSDESALSAAADLGTAMQLTNILRDIREDYAMGRIYLPKDEMARFEVTAEDLACGVVTDKFRELMRFQIDRARGYYASAARGIPILPDDGSRLCVRLMSEIYSGILSAIERNDYDVFSVRASVPLSSKLRIAVRTLIPVGPGSSRPSRAASAVPRGRGTGKSQSHTTA